MHLHPNFWVADCEIDLKGRLEMVLFTRSEIIFVYFTSLSCFNTAAAERLISGSMGWEWGGGRGEGVGRRTGLMLEGWYEYAFFWPVY